MGVIIRKYNPTTDYNDLISIIRAEGEEWKEYLAPSYKIALEKSITYVALVDGTVSGYSRSMNDSDIFIWLIDLLVRKEQRGQDIGKKLMECVVDQFPKLDVYVLSDVDPYYEKLGYKNEGTVFQVKKS